MVKLLFTAIWNASELSGIGLGGFAPYVFAKMIGCDNFKEKLDNS